MASEDGPVRTTGWSQRLDDNWSPSDAGLQIGCSLFDQDSPADSEVTPDALSRICEASTGFDVEALTAANEKYPDISIDAAPRKAILQTAELMKKFPQVRRRDRAEAISELTRYMVCGYRLIRYLFGTYPDQMLYSSQETAQQNANRLKAYMDTHYPELELLEAPIDAEFKGFITEGARFYPKDTIVERLFGMRLAAGIALTGQLDGIKVAMGEWDLFSSTLG
jgi:hypothetical protein